MTRDEASRLLLMADRLWFRGAEESVRRRTDQRTALALDTWEGDVGFDDEQMSLAQGVLGEPAPASTLPLESPRRRSRRGGSETSLQAAESVVDLRENQRAVRAALERLGRATDERLVAYYRANAGIETGWPEQSESGIRTRRHELVEQGFAEDSGRKAEITTGRQAIVWQPTQKR